MEDGSEMGTQMRYVITDGERYVGYDNGQQKNIIVDRYKNAVKLRFNQINKIYKQLGDGLLKNGEWEIVSSMEIKTDLSEASDSIDIEQFMDNLEASFDLLVRRKKFLDVELLAIEREITDIYHAMEFYNLDAPKGHKLYKMMQERLHRRRRNKDEALKIDYILCGGIKGLTSKQTRKQIEGLENRKYQPRTLSELFEA